MQHKKVIEDIKFEIRKIEKLLEPYLALLKKVQDQEPDFIELNALAMLLHSFYNGLENIFKQIARKIDGKIPYGEKWHIELLDQMIKRTKNRNYKVLNENTCKYLRKYLGFRHFSRHAYSFDLNWELMKDLVLRIETIKTNVLNEIRTFIENFKQNKIKE
ncbi:MAG: hypothetical protein HWN65_15060 [Candidatus Helarchaeota archaeon]|nr:hypothetical protein [Candidatus Helarchaeota archaeon]